LHEAIAIKIKQYSCKVQLSGKAFIVEMRVIFTYAKHCSHCPGHHCHQFCSIV